MEWRGGLRIWLIVVPACLIATGCQGVSIKKVGGGPSVSSSGRPERIARWARSSSTRGVTPPPPLRGLASASGDGQYPSDPDALLARSLASYKAGLDARRASREVAAKYQVDALADASLALASLSAEPGGRPNDPRIPDARVLSDSAQEEFLRVTSGRRVRLDEDWRASLAEQGISLAIVRNGDFLSPERFDEFLFVDDYAVKNLDHEFKATGLGVPLIALRKFDLKALEGRRGRGEVPHAPSGLSDDRGTEG